VCAHSTIHHSDLLVATEGELNPHSIDFELVEGNLNECAAFEDLLSEELDLRMMDATGDMDEMRERLRERLKRLKGFVDIVDLITHYSKNLPALVPKTKSIPCILHSEIGIAVKTLAIIFTTGIDCHDTKTDQLIFSDELAESVSKEILGSTTSPSQWFVPINDKINRNQVNWGTSRLVICVCRVLKSGSSWARSMLSSRNISQKKSRFKHYPLLNTTSKPRKS
jgi:hypothetical protein